MSDYRKLLSTYLVEQVGLATAGEQMPRLDDLAQSSPAVICNLVEPWLPLSAKEEQIMLCCARLHLYSRILDDALDLGSEADKRALLRAQLIFWRTVADLSALAPKLRSAMEKLLAETVAAVIEDDSAPSPACWGRKNHHLLLLPLLLGKEENYFFSELLPLLSSGLALLQAEDELAQRSFFGPEAYCAIVNEATKNVPRLDKLGFHDFANRLLNTGKRLLAELEKDIGE